MLRWLSALSVLSIASGLLASGTVPFGAEGLARILFVAYLFLMSISLAIGILRG